MLAVAAVAVFMSFLDVTIVPTSLARLLPEFPLAQRATATAIWGATGAVAAATGPVLGGALVSWAGSGVMTSGWELRPRGVDVLAAAPG
ncbi:MAG: hypothetical protein LH603_17310 [Pseudonocardia sp.]|nr:hypothetical protein [Pseudonocardia sp.]